MPLLKQVFNPVTGEFEWVTTESHGGQGNDDDQPAWEASVAGSHYGDMLWDKDRNEKYRSAIRIAVDRVIAENADADVVSGLDIGTGTGLLALMLHREIKLRKKTPKINACESFNTMAQLARKVVDANNVPEEELKIHNCQSDFLTREMMRLPRGAQIVVSEIVDSELIGEGIIPTMRDAHRRGLLAKGAQVIPGSMTLDGVVIDDRTLWQQCVLQIGENLGVHCAEFNIQSANPSVQRWLSSPAAANLDAVQKLLTMELQDPNLPSSKAESICWPTTIQYPGLLTWWTMAMVIPSSSDLDPITTDPKQSDVWRDHWMLCYHPLVPGSSARLHFDDIRLTLEDSPIAARPLPRRIVSYLNAFGLGTYTRALFEDGERRTEKHGIPLPLPSNSEIHLASTFAIHPWESLRSAQIRRQNHQGTGSLRIQISCVEFSDYWRCHAPLPDGHAPGAGTDIDLKYFNDLVKKGTTNEWEALPLWEYGHQRLTKDETIMEVDEFGEVFMLGQDKTFELPVIASDWSTCHGVLVHSCQELDDDIPTYAQYSILMIGHGKGIAKGCGNFVVLKMSIDQTSWAPIVEDIFVK
eukprot:Clim_evm12s213 gene=Clim_evmTU12s213